jgi:hypothetical protein
MRTLIPMWAALTAVLILGAPVARGGDLVECEPQHVTSDGRHWAYRIIDGRECWYPGRPGKPKNELIWSNGTSATAADPARAETKPSDQTAADIEPSKPQPNIKAIVLDEPNTVEAMPEEWRAGVADQLLASTCCWPELDERTPLQASTPEASRLTVWPLITPLPLALALGWLVTPAAREHVLAPAGKPTAP